MRYGFVGCGELGAGLIGSLLKAGFEVQIFDLRAELMAPLIKLGAVKSESAAETASGADAVITCLPNPKASEVVLSEILPAMRDGATWIEMSTLSRDHMQRLAGVAEGTGKTVLELPVTGGVHLAKRGEITMLVGGEKNVFERHEKAIQAMGNRVFHMGPIGSAAIIKVITNMLAFIHLKADAEALMLAKRGGLDLAQAWEAIKASSGNSFVHETEGALILNGSYDVGFNMDLALKDLGFALGFGREFGVPLELASMTEQTYVEAKAAYGGEAQSPMIAKLLEDRLDTDLRAEGFPDRLE
jgi:3-hydroxyisobutyrate dehydrogenase